MSHSEAMVRTPFSHELNKFSRSTPPHALATEVSAHAYRRRLVRRCRRRHPPSLLSPLVHHCTYASRRFHQFINSDVSKLSDKYDAMMTKNTGSVCPVWFIVVVPTLNSSG